MHVVNNHISIVKYWVFRCISKNDFHVIYKPNIFYGNGRRYCIHTLEALGDKLKMETISTSFPIGCAYT